MESFNSGEDGGSRSVRGAEQLKISYKKQENL